MSAELSASDMRRARQSAARRSTDARMHFAGVLLLLSLCGAATEAAAQERVSEARATGGGQAADTLALLAHTFGAMEWDTGRPGTSGSAPGISPLSSGLQLEVSRVRRRPRQSYVVQGSTEIRGVLDGGGSVMDNQRLAGSMQLLATRRTSLVMSQRLSYSPYYTPGSGADVSVGAQPARGAAALSNVTLASMAGISTRMSRRTSVTLEYRFDRVGLSRAASAASNSRASATLTTDLSRRAALSVRYGYLRAITVNQERRSSAPAHDAEVGLTYAPRRARNTTVTFGIVPNWSARPLRQQSPGAAALASTAGGRVLTFGGFVTVDHAFSRTWRAGLDYRRTLYYLPGDDRPVLADAIAARAAGNVHRRLMGSLSVEYSHGVPNGERGSSQITGANGLARLDFRASGSAALYAECRYDLYAASEDLPGLPGLGSRSSRSAVRVGLTLDIGLTARSRAVRQES